MCGCEPVDAGAGGGERGGGGPGAGEHGHEDQEVQVHRQHRHLYMVSDVLLCSPQDNEAPSPMVGGGILERKIISAR